MAIPVYTKRMLIQRIKKQVSNTRFVSDEFIASDNEILLFIDQAAASRIIGKSYEGAKIEGALCINEAYLITYQITTGLKQDPISQYWYFSLPHPPMSLPLGYSINRIYFQDAAFGQSQDVQMIKAKRVGRRMNMPLQPGVRGWVEGTTVWLATSNGSSLLGFIPYVQMPSARTTDIDAVMAMPEDDVSAVFDDVVKHLMMRYGVPQDVVTDNLPAGSKPV